MKDFRLYDIMDFVMDEDFIRWVQEKRPDDEAFWNNWLKSYPEKHLLVAEARRILESIRVEQKAFTDEEIDGEATKLLQTINGQYLQEKPRTRVRSVSPGQWMIAAVLAGLIVLGIRYFPRGSEDGFVPGTYSYAKLISSRSLIEQVNTSDKPISVVLADSSVVELSVNSRISYPRSFDSAGTRDVYLSGEAFFQSHQEPQPALPRICKRVGDQGAGHQLQGTFV